ncbi:unnamed protein product, partial [Didymodactylos carnosus]
VYGISVSGIPLLFMKTVAKCKNAANDDSTVEQHPFSLDTESEMSNNQLVLIRVHTIPRELPSLVILIELTQLPREESNMVQHLTHRTNVNRQIEFIPQNYSSLSSPCSCHQATNTLDHWSSSLTSEHSLLPRAHRVKMIEYTANDVMAVTYFTQPVIQRWTFEKMKSMNINEMFITSRSSKLPPLPAPTSTNKKNKKLKNLNVQKLATIFRCNDLDAEEISSDEEIYLHQLIEIEPPEEDHHQQLEPYEEEHHQGEPTVEGAVDEPVERPSQSNRKKRSSQSRKKQTRNTMNNGENIVIVTADLLSFSNAFNKKDSSIIQYLFYTCKNGR